MSASLRTIAVDLTPVLPGGENGGAKVFVLDLLHQLFKLQPKIQFLLLTQSTSHEELASLDCQNARRIMVFEGSANAAQHHPMRKIFHRMLRRLSSARLSTLLMRYFAWNLHGLNYDTVRLKEWQVDLLFCPFTDVNYFEPEIPTVCTLYDLQHKTLPQFFSREEIAHRDCVFTNACRRATTLVAISDYSRTQAIKYAERSLNNIQTIYLRMGQRLLSEQVDHRILSRLGLVAANYLIYPANFWQHKNHEMLLTAFNIACHRGLAPEIKLVCTGAESPRRTWLIRAIDLMGLTERVILPGYLTKPELASLMQAAGGVIFPSLYEGFGLPVIEAMAAEIPVACSDLTSLPEIAAHAAIFFNPRIPTHIADSILSLVNNATLRAELIRKGAERAGEFLNVQEMTKDYFKVFEYAYAKQSLPIQDDLFGVYTDGWIGSRLKIQVAATQNPQKIVLEFLGPTWLPRAGLKAQVCCKGKSAIRPFVLAPGITTQWSCPVDAVGGSYEIMISPSFVPAKIGLGDDGRNLTVLLQKCYIVRSDKNINRLYPKEYL